MSMIRTHTKAWESVPRAAAEDLRMSCQSRGVLFWLLTRPADWQVKIGPMMRMAGITKHTWPRLRKELISAGYLVAKKGRAAGGKIVWDYDVYSVSTTPPSPDLRGMVKRGVVKEPSPALPEVVLPSPVKQGTTDTDVKDTVFNKEAKAKAHTRFAPPLGEKVQGQKHLTLAAIIANFVAENPGLSLNELKQLRASLDQKNEVTL